MIETQTGRHAARRRSHRAEKNNYVNLVGLTAASNIAVAVVTAFSGVLLARGLGPAGRGTYGAIVTWIMVVAALGDGGLTSAICYYVARAKGLADRADQIQAAQDVVRTGGLLLVPLGAVAAVVAGLAVPAVLGGAPGAALPFYTAAAALPLICVRSCWLGALAAYRPTVWNLVRGLQALANVLLLSTLWICDALSVSAAVYALIASFAVQAALAVLACRLVLPARGRARRAIARDLLKYGSWNFLAAVPFLVNAHLDVLVLTRLVPAADVGHYVVALSLATVCMPACTAFGLMALPRIAASVHLADSARTVRKVVATAIGGSLLISLVAITSLCLAGRVLVEVLFGDSFGPAVRLLWLMAPGAVTLGCNHAMASILLGLNKPRAAVRCEGVSFLVTIAGMVVLVPVTGVSGAAIAGSAAYLVNFALLLHTIVRSMGGTSRTVEKGVRELLSRLMSFLRTRTSI